MNTTPSVTRLRTLLHEARIKRDISMRVLADSSGLNVSSVSRIEGGQDALLSTWVKLFEGLGYRIQLDAYEESEEGPDFPAEEAERRRERRLEGLCAGKRRYY